MPFNIPIARQIELARTIIPDLEEKGGGICTATCPGAHLHTTRTGARDWQIWFEEGRGPHDHCFHRSCQEERDAVMRSLWSVLARADPARAAAERAYTRETTLYRAAPAARKAPTPIYDPAAAEHIAAYCPTTITDAWLREHSPIPIPSNPHTWPRLLLDNLYTPRDHILIFTQYMSQGQILYTPGSDPVTLEKHPPRPGYTTPPRSRTRFPKGGRSGVWFLTAPVTGEWSPNPNNRDAHGIRLGRRHAACCTRYPYLVLESDEAPPSTWLRILVQLAHPIVAIYTSGGKSYHALIRVDCGTKEQFDLIRADFTARLSAIGADPAAITAVRLTRLPGCLRYGIGDGDTYRPYLDPTGTPAPRMQQLLYLAPRATATPIIQ